MPTLPQAILIDLDNTTYAESPCNIGALKASHGVAIHLCDAWAELQDFAADFAEARCAVRSRLGGKAVSHNPLLAFKRMVEVSSGETDFDAVRRLTEFYWKGFFSEMALDADCIETLAVIRQTGVRIAWVSNGFTERQMMKLNALGLGLVGDFLVTSEESGADLPAATTIDIALENLEVDACDAWLLSSDPERLVAAADAAGVTAVWFDRERLGKRFAPDADLLVGSWSEMVGLLQLAARTG